jgi:hypothetical protein
MKRFILSGTALLALMAHSTALAQRAERSTSAVVAVSNRCALTPKAEVKRLEKSAPEVFEAALGAIVAGIAGELVKSGLNAAGEALEAASREQGFVAEGTSTFLAGQIEYSKPTLTSADGSKSHALPPKAYFAPHLKCLHLFVQGATGSVDDIFSDGTLTRSGTVLFDWSRDDEASIEMRREAAAELVALGVNSLPDLYAEILLLPGREGFVAKPMLIWYREPLKGAPKKGASSAEMHFLFSTPAFDADKPGIGTGFAGARISLPKLEPKKVLTWKELNGFSSVTLPLRPTSGFVDSKVTAFNSAVASVGVAEANLRKAVSARNAAERLVQRDPKPEAQEALVIATENVDEAAIALVLAKEAISKTEAIPAGATNIQARLVIIRNANKFGLALAKALKDQSEAAGTAVTNAIAPKPDWNAEDTAYLTAIQAVEAKQKAYDVAIASGDAAATLAASHDLRLAKAKANEAAVSSKRAIPYPALLN